MQDDNLKNFPGIPKDFPDPSLYYNEDDIINYVFYESLYLQDVEKWFKKIVDEYDSITGHENSFAVLPNNIQDRGDAEYIRGYKTAIEMILKL